MVISRPAEHPFTLAVRFGGAVSADAELVVDQGDACVFARQAAPLRVLWTGTYRVPAEFAGPDVEVWFISMRPHMGLRFAGVFGSITTADGEATRVLGQYVLRVIEPSAFYSRFASSGQSAVALDDIAQIVNGVLMPVVSRILMENAATFHPSVLGQIASALPTTLDPEMNAAGLRVTEIASFQVI